MPPARRSTSALRASLLLGAVATLLALYGAEAAGRLLLALRGRSSNSPCTVSAGGGEWNLINQRNCDAALAAGRPFDTRSRLEVVHAYERAGTAAVPAVHAVSFLGSPPRLIDGSLLLPLTGISRATTVYCNESGDWVDYAADEHGFRNHANAHAAEGGIAIIGDSFAKGMCVTDDATVAARLAREGRPVLNLGADGSGPLLALAALREYASRVRPRHVVWLFFEGNDLRNLERERADPVVARYLEPGFTQNLAQLQPRIDSMLRDVVRSERAHAEDHLAGGNAFDAVHSFLLLATVRAAAGSAWRRFTRSPAPFDTVTFGRIVESIRRDAESWGGQVLFVFLPAWERFALGTGDPHYQAVIRTVADHGIDVLDLVPVFHAASEPTSLFPFGTSGHYTAEGYALVAREIERVLSQDSVIR